MTELKDKILVVGYWGNVDFVTDNKQEAEEVLVKKKGEAPGLPWSIRTVEEAVTHAYRSGFNDGRNF